MAPAGAVLTTTLLLIAVGAFAAQTYVPVHEEPRHRLVWESQNVRVLDLLIPPGDTTKFHIHNSPIFYVTLTPGSLRTQRAGERWVTPTGRPSGPGSVRFDDSYKETPVIHRVSNSGETPIRSILVLNERESPREIGDRVVILPGKQEIDSKWFRQSRVTLEAGDKLEWEGARARIVAVLVSGSHVLITKRKSEVEPPTTAHGMTMPGDSVNFNGRSGYTFENRSSDTVTLIVVAVL